MGSGRWLWIFNTEVTASPRITFLLCSYGWPIGLRTSFGMLEGTTFNDVTLSPSVILVCRGQGRPRQYILAVWIPFVRPRHFFLLGMGLGLDMKWAGVLRSFDPTTVINKVATSITITKGICNSIN